MMTRESRIMIIGQRVLQVDMEVEAATQVLQLQIAVDGKFRWASQEPGWRGLGQGTSNDCVYLWSARRVIVLPLDLLSEEPYALDCPDDIVRVFHLEDRWLLVAETSVRLITQQRETSVLMLPDAVLEAYWTDQLLLLQLHGQSPIIVRVSTDLLEEVGRD